MLLMLMMLACCADFTLANHCRELHIAAAAGFAGAGLLTQHLVIVERQCHCVAGGTENLQRNSM
jgi:hypothetical protein